MRKAVLTLAVTLALALVMALSTAVALAGWDWDDCPPASPNGHIHNSSPNWENIHAKANPHATYLNPGAKGGS